MLSFLEDGVKYRKMYVCPEGAFYKSGFISSSTPLSPQMFILYQATNLYQLLGLILIILCMPSKSLIINLDYGPGNVVNT